ncbi:hypothetical protein E2562_031670 [Oryza meyeriana var. granulata]|uniref:Uncharacterized protein n=1 Tax=Oryza meyeriana var. granulata TaxID=110450 RepID=A0A6G1E4V4_9ORYZ|nr:hypothetical protein E2562_031670 [Oryza meyeriana var. granulata]
MADPSEKTSEQVDLVNALPEGGQGSKDAPWVNLHAKENISAENDENKHEIPFPYVLDDTRSTYAKSGGYRAEKIASSIQRGGVYGTKAGDISAVTYGSYGKSFDLAMEDRPTKSERKTEEVKLKDAHN